jgi:hypothetical protein
MTEPKATPEEQILKLIENPANAGKGGDKSAVKSGEKFSLGKLFHFPIPKSPKSDSPAVKTETQNKVQRSPFVYVKSFNVFLIIAVLVSAAYLVLDLSVLKADPVNYLSRISLNDDVFPLLDLHRSDAQHDIAYYHQMVDKRNPFLITAGPVKEEAKAQTPSVPSPQSEKMAKVMQGLHLVGISWSGEIPLAMIEEVETGKTFFLREGQEINKLKVQSISKESVVVTYEGEEATLY